MILGLPQRHRGSEKLRKHWTQIAQMNADRNRQAAGFFSNWSPQEGVVQLRRVFYFYFSVCSGWICVHRRNRRPASSSVSQCLCGVHFSTTLDNISISPVIA